MASELAFIFDMDGVLWDSWSAHARAFRETLATVGIEDFDYGRYAGMRTDEVIECEFRRKCRAVDPESVGSLTRMKQSKAIALLQAEPSVVPAAPRVLATAAAQGPVGLATAASKPALETFLAVCGCASLFSAVVHGSEVDRAKPAGDIYALAARRLGVTSERCVVIEDAPNGVLAGKDAGMNVVALAVNYPPEELRRAGANWVLGALADLVEWMNEHEGRAY